MPTNNPKYQREWRQKNLTRVKEVQRANWLRKKELVNAYLDNINCMRCGEPDSRLLDFHHRDRTTKKFAIRCHSGRAIGSIFREIEKCDILCANCHRLVEHHGETY